MKKFYLSLSLCLLSIAGITAQTFDWDKQVLSDRNENLQRMGIADDGTTTIVGYGNLFFQTTDEGETWVDPGVITEADNFDYESISFSGNLGFACSGTFFKVADRPKDKATKLTGPDLYAMPAILKTTDGGENWEQLTVDGIGSSDDDDYNLNAIGNYGAQCKAVKVINDSVVYLSATWYDVNGGKHGNIFKSTNKGINWKAIISDTESKSIASITPYNGNIYIAGYQTLIKVNITTDEVTDLYSTVTALNKDDNMFFVKTTIYNNELIFPTYADSIWVTTDEGASFSTLPGGLAKGYYVYKYDDNHIVVAGGKNDTKATSDGGATWTPISAGQSLWNCGVTNDSLIGLSTGAIYSMAISDIAAGNFNWTSKNMEGSESNIKGIDTTNNAIFIAGYADYLVKSTDGGKTYTDVTLPSKSDMIYASVDLEFYAYGQGSAGNAIAATRRYKFADYPSGGPLDYYQPGLILATNDNWATHRVVNDALIGSKYGDIPALNPYASGCSGASFDAVECVDSTTMYVFVAWYDTTGVSYSDKTTYTRIFKTADAGASWDTITPDLNNCYIKDIEFDGETGYMYGSKTLYKTTDGGNTVTNIIENAVSISENPYVQDIACYGNNTIYVATTSDNIFISKDGGNTFSTIQGITGTSFFLPLNDTSFVALGGSTSSKYTSDNGQNWTDCYPGSLVCNAKIFNKSIIALSKKSTIYKQSITDLIPDWTTIKETSEEQIDIKIAQSSTNITLTTEAAVSNCMMYNIAGQKVLETMPNSTTYSFSTTKYNAGIYLLRVVANGKTTVKKIMIK